MEKKQYVLVDGKMTLKEEVENMKKQEATTEEVQAEASAEYYEQEQLQLEADERDYYFRSLEAFGFAVNGLQGLTTATLKQMLDEAIANDSSDEEVQVEQTPVYQCVANIASKAAPVRCASTVEIEGTICAKCQDAGIKDTYLEDVEVLSITANDETSEAVENTNQTNQKEESTMTQENNNNNEVFVQIQKALGQVADNLNTLAQGQQQLTASQQQTNDVISQMQVQMQQMQVELDAVKSGQSAPVQAETAATTENNAANGETPKADDNNQGDVSGMNLNPNSVEGKAYIRALAEFCLTNGIAGNDPEAVNKFHAAVAQKPALLTDAQAAVNAEAELVNHPGYKAVIEDVKNNDLMSAMDASITVALFTQGNKATEQTKAFINKLTAQFNNDMEKVAQWFRTQAKEKYNVSFIKNNLGYYTKEGVNTLADAVATTGNLFEVFMHTAGDIIRTAFHVTGTAVNQGVAQPVAKGLYKTTGTTMEERDNKLETLVLNIQDQVKTTHNNK